MVSDWCLKVPINTFSQQTQNICITFVQCWTNVEDVGPTLYKCNTNVSCLLGRFFRFLIPLSPHDDHSIMLYPENGKVRLDNAYHFTIIQICFAS